MFDPGAAKMQKIAFDLFRTTFNSAYNAMIHFQEQNEKTCGHMLGMVFRQLECCREESLKAFNEYVAGVQDTRNEFKAAVDEGYSKMAKIITEASKANSTAPKP